MMQVNPSDNLIGNFVTSSLQDVLERKVTRSDAVVNEFGSEIGSFIQKALQVDSSNDSEAVYQAKQAIANGTLDTPETVAITAEKLLNFGI